MTQDDKQLLLVDLCARLPYDVICSTVFGNSIVLYIDIYEGTIYISNNEWVDDFKPYLRSMSSMTEEEKEELRQEQIKDEQLFADCIKNHPEMRGLIIPHFAADWCDKNMFDYRGLIPKGLAIPVTEENNPYK